MARKATSIRVAINIFAAACGCGGARSGAPQGNPPDAGGSGEVSLTAEAPEVFVGERARLTAIFEGDSASIDGLGAVESGRTIESAPLARTTRFTLRVRRGAGEITADAAVRAAYRNRFRALPDAPIGRGEHVAFPLAGAGALLAGGHSADEANVPDSDSSEVFDPASERTTAAAELPFTVEVPSTTGARLDDGTLLIVGASINTRLGHDVARAAAVLLPGASAFIRTGDTVVDHGFAFTGALVALGDGGALLSGGSSGLSPIGSAERFDAARGQWRAAANLLEPRLGHTATRLSDGRVLVAGGLQCCKSIPGGVTQFAAATAEIYDPVADEFSVTGPMAAARAFHQATLLADGRVLVTGGATEDFANPPVTAEIWNLKTGAFTPAGQLRGPRQGHAAILLNDGRVLVTGGTDPRTPGVGLEITEALDLSGNWAAGPLLQPAWSQSTALLLDDGKVLVFGGEDASGNPVARTLLFE